jgi:hypothetical protein
VPDGTICKNSLVSIFLLNLQSTHPIPSPSHTKSPQPDTHRATDWFPHEKWKIEVSLDLPYPSIPRLVRCSTEPRFRSDLASAAPPGPPPSAPSSKGFALSRQIDVGDTSSSTRGRLRLETCRRGGLPCRRVVRRQVRQPASCAWPGRSGADARTPATVSRSPGYEDP